MTILYLCDGEGCARPCHGKSENCKHTSNILHAINFNNIAEAGAETNDNAVFVESEFIPIREFNEELTGVQCEK